LEKGCYFGTHRVIEEVGSLPQAAKRLNNNPEIYDNEILIDVETLNIDSASFTQIKDVCNNDEELIKKMILGIVNERGKMQNPVTGSGGMLIGKILAIGPNHPDKNLRVGDMIATLVSLTLTPLRIEEIKKVKINNDQVEISGKAILFASGIYSKLPDDLPRNLSLAALDVAGAPAQTDKLVKEGQTVAIIGAAGKSGILCTYQAMKNVGKNGKVIAIVHSEKSVQFLKDLKLADEIIVADATKAFDLYQKIIALNKEQVDVTINVVNVPNTENGTILITKPTGIAYFFSMATSFTKAALGAEGVGSDVTMIIGNGYTKNHDKITLNILKENKLIRTYFEEHYV